MQNAIDQAAMGVWCFVYVLQLIVLVGQVREARRSPVQTNAGWPLRFPVHRLVYMFGPAMAKMITGAWIVGNVLLSVTAVAAWFAVEESPLFFLVSSVMGWTGLLQAWLPRPCVVSDGGIDYVGHYPWAYVHRYDVNERRLMLVVDRPSDPKLTEHLEIPLNGLSPSLLPLLEQRVAEMTEKSPRSKAEEIVSAA